MEPTPLVECLIKEFGQIEKQIRVANIHSDKEWSSVVLTALCALGQNRDCYVCASSVDKKKRDYPEWLYDITWLNYDNDNKLKSVELVGECEWGNPGDIEDDFQKLLVARAQVRLMIYDMTWEGDIISTLRKYINAFCGTPSDTYLTIAYNNDGNKKNWWLEYRVFIVKEVGSPLFEKSGRVISPE